MAKDTNFKFRTHAQTESPDMTPEIFFEQVAWQGSRDPVNFLGLNANSSNMSKGTNFQFGKHAPTDSPEKIFIFRKGGVASVTRHRKLHGR